MGLCSDKSVRVATIATVSVGGAALVGTVGCMLGRKYSAALALSILAIVVFTVIVTIVLIKRSRDSSIAGGQQQLVGNTSSPAAGESGLGVSRDADDSMMMRRRFMPSRVHGGGKPIEFDDLHTNVEEGDGVVSIQKEVEQRRLRGEWAGPSDDTLYGEDAVDAELRHQQANELMEVKREAALRQRGAVEACYEEMGWVA